MDEASSEKVLKILAGRIVAAVSPDSGRLRAELLTAYKAGRAALACLADDQTVPAPVIEPAAENRFMYWLGLAEGFPPASADTPCYRPFSGDSIAAVCRAGELLQTVIVSTLIPRCSRCNLLCEKGKVSEMVARAGDVRGVYVLAFTVETQREAKLRPADYLEMFIT